MQALLKVCTQLHAAVTSADQSTWRAAGEPQRVLLATQSSNAVPAPSSCAVLSRRCHGSLLPAADRWCCAALHSGLTPLHPAFRAPDLRRALSAHHRLHSSIFDSKPSTGCWTTNNLGHLPAPATACDVYSLAAVAVQLPDSKPPADGDPMRLQLGNMQDCRSIATHTVDLPDGYPCLEGSAWSPGGTHHVQAMMSFNSQNKVYKLQLALLRMRDGARKLYTVEALDLACKEVPVLQVLWDPSAPQDRPRLAVVRASNEKARLQWLSFPLA